MADSGAQLVLELAVALVFLHAGFAKLLKPRDLASGIGAYQLLPQKSLLPVAIVLTGCELFIGVAHLTGVALPFAVGLAIALLLVLLGVVGHAMRRGASIECSCFGSSKGEVIGRRTLARILLLLATEIAIGAGAAASVAFHDRGFATVAGAAVVAVLCVTCGNWLLSADDLIAVFRGCASCSGRKNQSRKLTRGALP